MEILAENLDFRYGEKAVLEALRLSVKRGERVGVVGPSGCGKSTLLKIVAGLYRPCSGSLLVAGETEPDNIRRRIAMVMQSAMLFPATVRENVTCGHPMDESKVWAALEAASLASWVREQEEGLEYDVGERGGRLSGGQGQRLCIARAIAKDAPVVLLDEATSALDEGTQAAVLEALSRLMRGRTVLCSTHRLETLQGFDRVYRMVGGALVDA